MIKTKSPLKVLFATSEISPFSKTGGLADVAGSLPIALSKLGVDVRVATPRYKSISGTDNRAELDAKVPVYFIDKPEYFSRNYLYGGKTGAYADNLDRFVYFSKRTLELLKEAGFKPDIIHCNDWQTALIPVYLKDRFAKDPFYAKMKTVFTIHNIAYQGIFSKDEFYKTGLSWDYFTMHKLEFYDMVNLLKGGVVYSDIITTVSPTYAREITTPELGYGLEGALAGRKDFLFGIINGIDYNHWDPLRDKELINHFSEAGMKGKHENKSALQKECGLEERAGVFLIAMISRLADQKGMDLIANIIRPLLKLDLQFILLGTGEERYIRLFEEMGKRYKGRVSVNLKFDPILAKRIYAGSDAFLMPSRYEPCGLGQIISLRYGTIPVVRKTGGLADTITEYNPGLCRGNGFLFERYDAEELFGAVSRAFTIYGRKELWNKLVMNAMRCDFSWNASAKKYLDLYKKIT